VLITRALRPMQAYISELVHQVPAQGWEALREKVLLAAHVVDTLHRAAGAGAGGAGGDAWGDAGAIPPHEFYNGDLGLLSDDLLDLEYRHWVSSAAERDAPLLVSLCQVPYLLDPETKSRVLLLEALYQKHHEVRSAHAHALSGGGPAEGAPWLHVRVRRTHLLEDALREVVHRRADLKKPLRVVFVSGGVEEEGLDEGGVAKEFFQLLIRELFDASYGMFGALEGGRYLWFDARSGEPEVSYQLVGTLLGLAIYNGHILDVHLPPVAYKKLLGVEPTLADLRATFPALAHGLEALLGYGGDVEGDLCYTFEVDVDLFGEPRTVELVPGGAAIAVTADNRRQFVELYARYVLEEAVRPQFDAFAAGFLQVCGGPALSMFEPRELELLVCGLPHLDFDALERGTQYEGGYGPETPVVRDFWAVVKEMTLEEKRRLLSFTTGSDRAPVGGLGSLQMVVQRNGGDTMRLPTSHTCFNVLLLPEYAGREKLRSRLLLAIGNARGFGLQ